MLEAVNLTKSYKEKVVLHGLTLTIEPGEIYCLLGANGAGKSTTINLFLGFLKPSSGVARINTLDVTLYPRKARQQVAFIPDQVMLYPRLNGMENLAYFSSLGGAEEFTEKELLTILADAGLREEQARRPAGTYSKGMRQKVGIAIAMARNVKCLLLDEPTNGLDPQAANEFSKTLAAFAAEGVSVLMATHDLFRAKEINGRVGILKNGRLVQEIKAADVGHADLEQIYLKHMHD
ncbi:MAG: ABC transporter ATP-binding protein [Bryobacter sp.]|jgi:ABC-2 type transport system ATP-binding protein|nr:ABC transporter ATP-binding protein [Bryobacter sp.]